MRKGNATPLFLLSIIFPGIGFLLSIRKIWNKQYQKIILLFAFWLGFTAFFFGGDILEYKNAFPITGKYTWNSYFYLVTNSFSEDRLILFPDNVVNSKPDIYALTLQFIISRFTDNERWFFGFVSLIYAFLFLKFINEVLVFSGINKTKPWRFFFACLLLIVPLCRSYRSPILDSPVLVHALHHEIYPNEAAPFYCTGCCFNFNTLHIYVSRGGVAHLPVFKYF